MLKPFFSAGLLGALMLLGGCSSMPAQPPAANAISVQLLNQPWLVTHIGNSEVGMGGKRPSQAPSLQLDSASQRFSGSDGCNRIMGSYQLTDRALKFGPLASTRMLCMQPNDQRVAAAYSEALAKVSGYQIYDQTLRLLDRHGNVVMQLSRTAQ